MHCDKMLQYACHMILHTYKHEFIYLFVSKHRGKKSSLRQGTLEQEKLGYQCQKVVGPTFHGYKELKCCLLYKESVGKMTKEKEHNGVLVDLTKDMICSLCR
jgi:hypothetical protein